jgi:sulfur-carrier protein
MEVSMTSSRVGVTVTVTLPTALRARTGQRTRVDASGQTIRDVIESLDHEFPGLRFNFCYETGELRPFVNIFLDGVNVRYLSGLDTHVHDGAAVHILPSVAGG